MLRVSGRSVRAVRGVWVFRPGARDHAGLVEGRRIPSRIALRILIVGAGARRRPRSIRPAVKLPRAVRASIPVKRARAVRPVRLVRRLRLLKGLRLLRRYARRIDLRAERGRTIALVALAALRRIVIAVRLVIIVVVSILLRPRS